MINYILIFGIGAIMGSFFYVVGTRLPENKSIIKPRSHCTYCNHPLNFFDFIPIISFLFLRGKCRYCKEKLDKRYILYEILTGTLYLISYIKYGISYNFFIVITLSSLLVLIFITDFKYMIILDSPLIVSVILIFLLKLIYYGIYEALFSLVYGLAAFLTMLFIRGVGNFLFKKESLGGGDIKLSFIMGMSLSFGISVPSFTFSYELFMLTLILATFLAFPYAIASTYFLNNKEIPFGPFLISSLFIIVFFFDKFKYLLYFI